jgi:hypothetical protein
MRRRGALIVPGAVLAGLIVWACGQDSTAQATYYEFGPEIFDNPTVIDNAYWPHTPGTQLVYDGFTVEEGDEVPHRIVITFTDLVKVIGGVNAVVVWERDISDGQVMEAELAFRAQDNDGNVWHLGEYSEVYEDGELVGGKTWLVGHLEGARAGVMVQGNPQPGTPAFSEGFAPPPVNWTDFGRVRAVGQSDQVATGSYDDVIIVEEYNQEEPGAFQLKSYARGLGLVRVGWSGADATQEELELVEVIHLDPEALAQARAEALKLEQRAYVYGSTPPARQRDDTPGG